MDPQANLFIILLMVIVGGGMIGGTFYAFSIFSRFLDREKQAGERFRAEHGAKDSPEQRK